MSAVRRPRVGLLATGLTAPTGTGVYARRLARWLPEVAPDLDFVLFAQAAFLASMNWQDRENARAVPCAPGGPLRRIAAEQLLLPRLLRREKPDLLHALSLSAPPSLPCPFIVTVHDLGMFACPQHVSIMRRTYLRWAVEDCTRRAAAVVADSRAVGEELRRLLHVPGDRLCVIGLGVDPVPEHRPIRRGHLLMLGAGEPRKRADLLVAAYRRATRDVPLPELILAGRHVRAAEEETPHGRIRRLPFVDETQREELLSTAGLVISPSDYEGYDLPPHEALARGVPVLLSDIPVHREIYASDAHYFPSGDVEALARRLLELVQAGLPPAPSAETIARRRAQSWQETAKATAAVYRTQLARHSPAPPAARGHIP